jgi:FSR family fosmidomycin resistance protein-like MFS transporter
VLAILMLVVGVNSASLHAIAPVMAGRLSGRKLGMGMGIWMVGGELGRTLGPIIIVTAIQFLDLSGTPWLMIGGFFASLLLYFRLKDVPGRPDTASESLPWRTAMVGMGAFMLPLAGLVLSRNFVSASLTTYLPTFLREEGAEIWFAGLSLAVLEAAGVVGAMLGGTLSDKLGRRTVLLVSMLTTPLLMFAFLNWQGWVRFPLLLLLGFVSLSIVPVIMALVQESFPENRALANGIYMGMSFVVRSVGVLGLGIVSDFFGMRVAFAISAVIMLLGVPLLWVLPFKPRAVS